MVAEAELIDRIIVSGILNYLSFSGPYHECMEELRQNKYMRAFRHWIIDNHSNIQRIEVKEMYSAVEQSFKDVQENIFIKYAEDNSSYSLLISTGNTILKMVVGMKVSAISVIDAFAGRIAKEKLS